MKTVVSKLLLAPLVGLIALFVGVAGDTATANAQEAPDVYPFDVCPERAGGQGKQVNFFIDVNNRGTTGKYVDLELVQAPEGWGPVLKDRGFVARSVWVRPATADGQSLESVELQVTVPADAEAKDYKFIVRGTGDGITPSTLTITVGVKDEATKGPPSWPSTRLFAASLGARFGFKADLKNDSEEERTYGLSFTAPEGWDVVFKPSYEQSQISSAQVKSGSTQGLDIQVTPPARVEAGEYPITVTAASPSDRSSAELKVTITGTYKCPWRPEPTPSAPARQPARRVHSM